MTARFRDFGSPKTEAEPLSFKLHDQEFVAYPQLPGKFLLDIAKKSQSDNAADSAEIVTEFFEKALVPESAERFNALIVDPDVSIQVETLAEIVGWLVEEYAGRPESPPEAS